MSQPPLTWVIGSGGLLGSNVERALASRGPIWCPMQPIPWNTPEAGSHLAGAVLQFAAAVGERPWQIAWCAGAGVVATSADALNAELTVLRVFLEALSTQMPRGSDGAAFLASSAGGVYAGSTGPPFTEETAVRPISPYGEVKLRLEQGMTAWAAEHRWPVVIGRIANLYGAGQNVSKPQGLISQVCRAHLLRQPISIYVPLDTLRDYLYARDCGELVADVLDRARQEGDPGKGGPVRTKILASQRGVTIGAVLGELRRVLKQSIRVVRGASATAKFQASDLRMRSVVWPELDRRMLTPLPAGMRATVNHMIRQLQAGSL
ncbi:MAG: NAD-dependent epimerase/dehydratase family protein [Jiangellaceae bacterium]